MIKRRAEGKAKFYANESFLAEARKNGHVRRVKIPVAGIRLDYERFQPRVEHLIVHHVQTLSNVLKEVDADGAPNELEPIVAFEMSDGTLIVVDGFHRVNAYRKADRTMIPCDILEGFTRQQAVEFAAACNQRSMQRRNRDDAKKAVFMLLENGWLEKSASSIARQAGVPQSTASLYLLEYCTIKDIVMPRMVALSDGRRRHRPGVRGSVPAISRKSRGEYRARVAGRDVYLGMDENKAQEKLAGIVANRKLEDVSIRDFKAVCSKRGVLLKQWGGRGVGGWTDDASAVVACSVHTEIEYWAAVAKVLLVASDLNLPNRVVVRVRQSEPRTLGRVENYARRLGVEFMTLEEFVAAVKADES